MKRVVVAGGFDNIRSRHVRLLQEASRLGSVRALLWNDDTFKSIEGGPPKFPREEREYLLRSIRYIDEVAVSAHPDADSLPAGEPVPDIWVVDEASASSGKKDYCSRNGIEHRVLRANDLKGFPIDPAGNAGSGKRVIVTGCYDWFHSGHVAFFEEVSDLGDLHVVVGQDANIRLLKGEGHPLFPQDERAYMVGAIRFVSQALVSTGYGWLDAEPEIAKIKPDIYAVNEDGDVPGKREFCAKNGIEYVVLKRVPKKGLPRRESTTLRGF